VTIEVSAIICTLDRPHYLRLATQSIVNQALARERYEVLIVDNSANEKAERMIRGEFGSVPNLRYIWEPILGLSRARNTGWRNAVGKYVAYLDDDAVACPRWLETILGVFQTHPATLGCVGGKIDLRWDIAPPNWLSAELMSYLGRIDWSEVPCVLPETQWLGGGNIAFPRRLLAEIGGFRNDLGRIGTRLLSSEEILVRQQLEAQGHPCFYHPEIQVWHHVPTERMTQAWFRRRCYWQGVSNAVLQTHRDAPSAPSRLGTASRELACLLASPRRLVDLGWPTRESAQFLRHCGEISKVGYVAGLLGLS
jgi:glycosyltransferase involved in cell wall biosynthesis